MKDVLQKRREELAAKVAKQAAEQEGLELQLEELGKEQRNTEAELRRIMNALEAYEADPSPPRAKRGRKPRVEQAEEAELEVIEDDPRLKEIEERNAREQKNSRAS